MFNLDQFLHAWQKLLIGLQMHAMNDEEGGSLTLETFSIAFLRGTANVKLQFHV